MKRFLPITDELSLIREKHRVLVQYLRLSSGNSLSCSAALTKHDLKRARGLEEAPTQGGDARSFQNELAQLSWTRSEAGIRLQFLDRGETLVDVLLEGDQVDRWLGALAELTPGS